MDEKTWLEYVTKYGGEFLVWIDQTTDPGLKDQNSAGVCFAMAFDFVTAYQMGQPGPGDFVNDIRNTLLISPKTSRIPSKYLAIQAASQAMLDQYRQNLKILADQLQNAEAKDKPAIQAKINQFLADRIKQRYGPGMESNEKFTEENMLAPGEIFNRMKASVTKNGPSYFLVEMRGSTGGHAIAFGFRPDLSRPPQFPGIYEYFDANLGLFEFASEKNLNDFLNEEVWADIYGNTDYSRFEITSFTAKKGKR